MMFNGSLNLFSLLGILCICLCVGSSHIQKCRETDKQALLKLKGGFIDKVNMLSSWNGEDCCKWKGISCNNITGHVTDLDLNFEYYFTWIEGKLDSSICELQHLTSLNLSHNLLQGNIPKCIGSLGQLIELKLADNGFVGVVPQTLWNLSHLQTLDLQYNNHLVANDFEWLSHLSHLRVLYLSAVDLSQVVDWQSSISKIPSLIEVHLDSCGLRQVNLESIPHMNSSTSLKILDLSYNNLNSSILSWVVNVSKVLTDLDLSYNCLQSIPKSFQSLCQLGYLRLNSNKLSGQLSDNIRQMCGAQNSLVSLDLSDNPFSHGPLPNFSWLSSLTTLHLRNTNIIGPLQQSFIHLPNLGILDLSYNHLNGTLPSTIGQFSNLNRLYLSSNKLSGVIKEAHLSNLSMMEYLDVAENSLSFNLSLNWVPPFQLKVLSASSCILGPKFPIWLKQQKGLQELYIPNAGISDSFPKWFWGLSSSLFLLNVSHNKLSGALPKLLPAKTSNGFTVWDFSFNQLFGPLPPFPELSSLFLSNNMFSGSLYSFCASSHQSLIYLDLSSNLLVGPLPNCWRKFQSLQVLNLAKNNLSGKIPKSFGTLRLIEAIHLNDNNFIGEIPPLTLCSSLRLIDFGKNNLQGTLPTWVGHHLHGLIVLRLQANKFQGNIPSSLCNLLYLQVLDLSENNITGKIPQCLSHIIALSNIKFQRKSIGNFPFPVAFSDIIIGFYYDSIILTWKGENIEYQKNLGLMTTVDLSSNHLIGEIPQSITNLVALAGLNLSRNNLTGLIPRNIGYMKMLESLDLSRNHFCGIMPASFSYLTFLSYMDLSFNNLSGKIPLSTQLQSFDGSMYEGNSGLCGPPLTNHCLGDVISSTTSHDEHLTDEDELITFGFYISLGLGFSLGFWGVCVTLVMKTTWRHAYFQFCSNMNDRIYVLFVVFMARLKRRFQDQG